MIVKNPELKNYLWTSLKKGFSSSSFPVQKTQFTEFKDWALWNSMYKIWSIPLVIFTPSLQLRIPPSYFENSPTPNPQEGQIWNLPTPKLVLGGSHYAAIVTFYWYLIPLSSYHSIPTFSNSNMLKSFNAFPHMIF